jgi:hypothetical protein
MIYSSAREELETKLRMIGLGSTSETINTERRFTIVGPTISPYNNEWNPCSTTLSCPKLNVEGQVFPIAINDILNPTTIHKLPKSPFKPIVMAHLIILDDDFCMNKIV